MQKLKILITGAGGFIGSALCIQLSTDNRIIGVDITPILLGSMLT